MKKDLLITLWIAIAATMLCNCAPRTTATTVLIHPNDLIPAVDPAYIQASSILIVVQSGLTFNDLSVGYGIGTLIEHQGQAFLVTHNHWGEVLESDTATVEFRDAHNRLIQPLFSSAFKELIVYQNPGTLVLRAIPALLEYATPTKIVDASLLEPGALVRVAYRQLPERDAVAVLEAEIVKTGVFEGEPVYQIRCLEGQGLQKGDSGGGVWYNGSLIGNNWAVLVDKKAVDTVSQDEPGNAAVSDTSYTAILKVSVLNQ
jgi:hypothetical protein